MPNRFFSILLCVFMVLSSISIDASDEILPVGFGKSSPQITLAINSNEPRAFIGENFTNAEFIVPRDALIKSIYAFFNFSGALDLISKGIVNIKAEIWVSEPGTYVFMPSGAYTNIEFHSERFLIPDAFLSNTIDLNFPVKSGSKLLIGFSVVDNDILEGTILNGVASAVIILQ